MHELARGCSGVRIVETSRTEEPPDFLTGSQPLEVGCRVRLSELGRVRSRKISDRAGIVVGFNRSTSAIRVLFEGRKTYTTLHRSYLEADV